MSGAVEEGAHGAETEDKSSSSSFEDLAVAEVEEARRDEQAEKVAAEENVSTEQKAAAVEKDEWQDVLGSGVLLKKIIKEGADDGEDGPRPQRGDSCRVSYSQHLRVGGGAGVAPGELVEQRDDVKIYLGDSEVLQGVDLALSLMHAGEECLLQIAPRFAYGDRGLSPGDATGSLTDPDEVYSGPQILADTWLYVKLTLHGWSEEPDHETLSFAERMRIGCRRRRRGNWWYSRGDSTLAVQLYRRALDALDESAGGINYPGADGGAEPTSSDLHELLNERIRVQNNMAAAQLRAGAYDAALQAVNQVLTCQPGNAKALFRRARILVAMGRVDEAYAAARAAAAAAPQDTAVIKELAKCEAKVKRDRSAERRLARRMLGADPKLPGDPKKPSRTKFLLWGSLLLSLVVGVASVLVYRYRSQAQ